MKSSMRNMVLSLGGISLVVASMLSVVNMLTSGPIAESSARAAAAAVAAVLPPFDNNPLAAPAEAGGCTLYPAMSDGRFVGAAVRVETLDGFSGRILVMVGFDASGAVTGYTILEHAETPGLGAKAQEWFSDTVGHRSIIGSDSPIALVKDGGCIDGITAATITSRAFLGAVNNARRAFNEYVSKTHPK